MYVAIINNADFFHERSRRELVECFVAQGHRVLVIAPGTHESAKEAGWPCTWRNWPLAQHSINPFTELSALFSLIKTLRRERPDVLLNFKVKAGLYGTVAGRCAGVPRISTIFAGLGHYFVDPVRMKTLSGKMIRTTLRLVLRRNACVILQNPDDAALFVKLGVIDPSQRRQVNGSGINLVDFAPAPPPPPGPFVFVLISRLLRDKGIIEYCEAARIVRATNPDVKFVLCGTARTEPTAIRAEELAPWASDGTIDYRGNVKNIRAVLAACNVAVLPSYYAEGVPRSLLEALAMGRPIITTDRPGCRMTVENDCNGYLVPPRDSKALAATMLKMIATADRLNEMGLHSRMMAETHFDVYQVMSNVVRYTLPP